MGLHRGVQQHGHLGAVLAKEQGHQNAAHAAGQGGDARHGAGDKGETGPPRQVSTPITIIKPVRNRGDAVIRGRR